MLVRYTSLGADGISLRIAQVSIFVFAVGSAGIGLASTIWSLIVGECQSLLQKSSAAGIIFRPTSQL